LVLRVLKVPPEPLDPMGDVRELRVFRAAPGYYHYRLLGWGLIQAVAVVVGVGVAVGIVAGGAHGGAGWATLAVALAGLELGFLAFHMVFSYVTLRLNYELRWYKVTDRSLRIREGVFSVREMTMTFANIQNIDISQGPLQKLFGIADLRVQSAGGGSGGHREQPGVFDAHTAYFRGVDNAEEIRDLMLSRLRHLRDAGLGDHEDAALGSPAAPAVRPRRAEIQAGPLPAVLLAELAAEARGLRSAAEAAARAAGAGS
jgi:uncharacterized membrane protein YdbT with pleckstrin-like domain